MSELNLLIRKSILIDSDTDPTNEPLRVPPSKSYTHRAIIAAALSSGKTVIKNYLQSDDIRATLNAIQLLGAKVSFNVDSNADLLEIVGIGNHLSASILSSQSVNPLKIDCGESGTTLRFLIPICALLNREIILTGKSGLLKRPVGDLVRSLRDVGVKIQDNDGFPPVKIQGGLNGGKITLRGDVSSQFISGLLFALPLAEQDSEILLSSDIESVPYIEMTLDVLRKFGIVVNVSKDYKNYRIKGNQKFFTSSVCDVEGDYSSAAFLLAAGVLAGPSLQLTGLSTESKQGDRAILSILKEMGAIFSVSSAASVPVISVKKSALVATTIDVRNTPDLVPILAVLATQAKGSTKIINAGRLRLKESDRLSAITSELRKLGAVINEKTDSLEITGPTKLRGATIDPYNDHRIAMACTVAGLIADDGSNSETKITHPEVVSKSYPDFFYHMRKLGANILSETASIGEKFKIQLYGGSHERLIGVKIYGLPIGTEISIDRINEDLNKRKSLGSLTTPRKEQDELHSKNIKGIDDEGRVVDPKVVVFEIENNDVNSKPYELTRFTPRPNHGDYTTFVKYDGVFDFRGGGFLSARMTVGSVIAGSIAKQILEKQGIRFAAYVKQIGTLSLANLPSMEEAQNNTYKSEVRCPDLVLSEKMKSAIEKAKQQQDSLGGIIECQVHGLPIGIGEPIFNAVDSVLAHYLFSIPAVKGVEFGAGFASSSRKGSENNDQFTIIDTPVTHDTTVISTKTNHSGGIQGGITNGLPLVLRVGIKPTSSIAKEQTTVDIRTNQPSILKVLGRHDPCVAVRAPIIIETMVAIALLDLVMRMEK
ncbi:3-phosphoshikimate 1-carboxyvinyltransferase [Candidatus Micrarchaeota archaeon]|nr:3-phosphoshikimate 1-carboxyvinyltransferase [Candidatus Micrarchaeota archaeon]